MHNDREPEMVQGRVSQQGGESVGWIIYILMIRSRLLSNRKWHALSVPTDAEVLQVKHY
jgi:hypothetical protein